MTQQIISTGKLSIGVQLITGAIDVYGLQLEKIPETTLLRDLLSIELGVQVVELIFYIWMIYNIKKFKNVTIYRYVDWFITTPVMLITLMAYLGGNPQERFIDFFNREQDIITKVVALNFAMLTSGFLGEIDAMSTKRGAIVGFIPFVIYYNLIYERFMVDNINLTDERRFVFWFFFAVWSLYGFSAFQNYNNRNVAYNFLDLIAKNAFGVYIVYRINTTINEKKQ
jgi:bacteriorhodopsin